MHVQRVRARYLQNQGKARRVWREITIQLNRIPRESRHIPTNKSGRLPVQNEEARRAAVTMGESPFISVYQVLGIALVLESVPVPVLIAHIMIILILDTYLGNHPT